MVNRFETGFTNPVTGCTENPVLTALIYSFDNRLRKNENNDIICQSIF